MSIVTRRSFSVYRTAVSVIFRMTRGDLKNISAIYTLFVSFFAADKSETCIPSFERFISHAEYYLMLLETLYFVLNKHSKGIVVVE
jgi:hypothetical protein